MTDQIEDLKNRLVIGHKSDGRCVYDEQAKAELLALCRSPGVSIARLARDCGINTNQVARWLRERDQVKLRPPRTIRAAVAPAPPTNAFVALALPGPAAFAPERDAPLLKLQARLPNGVSLDLGAVALGHLEAVIQSLGRVTCSVSTRD